MKPAEYTGPAHLDRAARVLADRGRSRALEISGDVLAHVMSRPRRSMPVRAHPPHDRVHVSEQVIIDVVSRAVARRTLGLSVARMVVTSTADERLDRIVVELIAQYGTELVVATAHAHQVVTATLRELIGPADDSVQVTIVPTHLHVGGVTIGDPQLSDPDDE